MLLLELVLSLYPFFAATSLTMQQNAKRFFTTRPSSSTHP